MISDMKKYKHERYLANKAKHITSAKESKRKLKEWFKEYKSTLACLKCGENHPACIDFHHKDPLQKDFTIGESLYMFGKQTIIDEINKCDILCSNCHRKLHYK